MDEQVGLSEALSTIRQTKEKIQELESMLPVSANRNFRERLVQELEHGHPGSEFLQKARELLSIYKDQFGVKDLIDHLDKISELD